ncbi:multi-sensor signal transduction histidine kinase [Pedosphaera parvula Ellin514]|uniref:histidine kinase n=1 Tax=Pedosphaera parvula (strain Ellin514) TaxID=320771 RepID=B9XQV4_PEDPL|nr:PAS domain S-box protein [Pedosphaera parvula]EEF57811.1 multi-sensor signal transduction histidine kinase [Pedosphaera parvula Ellin514]
MVHLVVLSLLFVIDTQFFVFFLLLPNQWARWLAILLTFNFTLPPLLLLNKRGHTRLAGVLLLTELWMMATVLALTAHGIHALAVLMFIVYVLIAGLVFGGRGGVVAGVVFCLTALGVVLVESTGHLPKSEIVYTLFSIWALVAICMEFIAIFQFLANRSISAALNQARETEIALRESERRYREVFETTSDSIFLMDVTADGRFLINRYNPMAEKVVGLTTAEISGKTTQEIFPPDQSRQMIAHYKQCIAQGSPISYEEPITAVYGQNFIFYTTLIPIKNTEGRISRFVGVAHDVTERKKAEAALRHSRDELEARVQERTAQLQHVNAELRQVNQELDAFSYSVSHDLRRPLRTVTGFAELLMSDHAHELSGDALNLLTMTRDSALQMSQMIEALLSLSYIDRQPIVPRPVNLTALMRQTANELQAEYPGRNMDIQAADLPGCMGDPALLRQVFVNLLSNAMKYTRNRPVAVIEVGSKAEDGEGMTIYFVRDNGVGFDMRYADKLFGVFQRMHQRAGVFRDRRGTLHCAAHRSSPWWKDLGRGCGGQRSDVLF